MKLVFVLILFVKLMEMLVLFTYRVKIALSIGFVKFGDIISVLLFSLSRIRLVTYLIDVVVVNM